MGLLIDSTVLIRAERADQTPDELVDEIIDRWGDVELAISVITAAEQYHGVWRADTPARRARRQEFIDATLAVIPVLPVTLAVARVFGELDAKLCIAGRSVPTPDLLIGATALCHGHELVTANLRDFRRIPDLVVHELR